MSGEFHEGQQCCYYPPPVDAMDNRHWPCDVIEMRGPKSVRVRLYTSDHPAGIERTVPANRLVIGQRVIGLEHSRPGGRGINHSEGTSNE